MTFWKSVQLFGLVLLIVRSDAIKRYYATESCGRVLGPDQCTVLEFDQYVAYNKKVSSTQQDLLPPVGLRNTVWECIIVIRGMPSTTEEKWIGIQWRDFHVWDRDIPTAGERVEDCGKAYVTIYQGLNTSAESKWTFCGKDPTRSFFEWPGDYVTLQFYVDFRRNASYTTPVPPPTTTTQQNCIERADAQGNRTPLPLCTTPKPGEEITTPDPDTYPYPELLFRIDVTSFDYACNKTIDGQVLKCNESLRCLDASLACDFVNSQNCKSPGYLEDKSDQTKDAPAYCGRKETTTPLPTTTTEAPVEPFDWTPIAAAVGGFLALLVICWCCWRPGYLPWRLARLRNVPFFNTQKCVFCRRGPLCMKCCAGDGQADASFPGTVGGDGRGFVRKKRSVAGQPFGHKGTKVGSYPYNKIGSHTNGGKYVAGTNGYVSYGSPVNGYGQDPDNFATDWLKFITGDGAHLREQR